MAMRSMAAAVFLAVAGAGGALAHPSGEGGGAAPLSPGEEGPGEEGLGEEKLGDGACAFVESRDWAAWINAQPGPGARPTLHVRGVIDLPTPGYQVSWSLGPADRRLPPAQYLELSLTPPDGPVAAVISPTETRFETPAVYPRYRAVVIRCAGRALARIEDVPVAQ